MLVQKQSFQMARLPLECGSTLSDVKFGYETYGRLNTSGDNAIIVCHYFSGTSHAAGRYHENDVEPGYWDAIIGPGKAIDTDRFFVVGVDTLCNLNTRMPNVFTTGPASIDALTGQPYGASFPVVTIGDFVQAQKALCDDLGISKLHAAVGPSMGGLQAMEWAARFPKFVDRVLSVISAGLASEPYLVSLLNSWSAPIRLDRNFNGGHYTIQQSPFDGLVQALKLVTLTCRHHAWASRIFSGMPQVTGAKDPAKNLDANFPIEKALLELACLRAETADANSFLRLCRAVQLYNIRDRIKQIEAKFLMISAESDLVMFPAYAEQGAAELRSAGIDARFELLKGDGGHLDGVFEITKAAELIRNFLHQEKP